MWHISTENVHSTTCSAVLISVSNPISTEFKFLFLSPPLCVLFVCKHYRVSHPSVILDYVNPLIRSYLRSVLIQSIPTISITQFRDLHVGRTV